MIVTARITDVLGDEVARGAFTADAAVWHFVLMRDCWPGYVEISDGDRFVPRVKLQPYPALKDSIVAIHVRMTVTPEMERLLLWLVAFVTWHVGRFR